MKLKLFFYLFAILIIQPDQIDAQTLQADLSLEMHFVGFEDGILVGETGTMVIEITNHGPDEVDATNRVLDIAGWHRYTDSTISPFVLFNDLIFNTPACAFIFPHIDPRPPIDDFVLLYWLNVQTYLDVNQTFHCEASITITEVGFLATRFSLSQLFQDGTDPNLDNNDVYFNFRGQAIPLSLNITFILMALLLLITGLFAHFESMKKT